MAETPSVIASFSPSGSNFSGLSSCLLEAGGLCTWCTCLPKCGSADELCWCVGTTAGFDSERWCPIPLLPANSVARCVLMTSWACSGFEITPAESCTEARSLAW